MRSYAVKKSSFPTQSVCTSRVCRIVNSVFVPAEEYRNHGSRSNPVLVAMPLFRDISGQRFAILVAMWPAGYKGPRREIMYLCQCDCRERVPIRNDHLRNGIAKSCGCKSKRGVHGPRTLHGMSRSPELAAYCGAIVRCTKPKSVRWKHYGERH